MGISIGMNQAEELLEKGISEAEDLIKEPSKVDELLVSLEGKLQEVPVIGETLSDIPLMISMVKAYITREYTVVSPKVIACIVGSFIYLVKKKDLIPDNLPVIGAADDIAVIGLALKLSEPELQAFAEWRDGGKPQDAAPAEEEQAEEETAEEPAEADEETAEEPAEAEEETAEEPAEEPAEADEETAEEPAEAEEEPAEFMEE